MSKLVLPTIQNIGGNPKSAQQALNEAFSSIEAVLDTIVSRDGTALTAFTKELDMNSFRITNLGEAAEPDLVFIAGLAGDFYGIRTYPTPAGSIVSDSGFLSSRFTTGYNIIIGQSGPNNYDLIVYGYIGPFAQDIFNSIILVDFNNATFLTNSADQFFYDSFAQRQVWEWHNIPDIQQYTGGQQYSLRFT